MQPDHHFYKDKKVIKCLRPCVPSCRKWFRQTGIAGDRLLFAGGTTTQHHTSCTVTYPAIYKNWWFRVAKVEGSNKLTSPGPDCSPGGHGWLCASWCFYPSAPQPCHGGTNGWSASAWSPHCLPPQWSIWDSHPEVATKRAHSMSDKSQLKKTTNWYFIFTYIDIYRETV